MAWKSNVIYVFILKVREQYIHARIMMEDNRQWVFTAIYASSYETSKKVLWDELKDISSSMRESWLLADDFNDIAYMSEKRGGVSPSLSRCTRILNRMDSYNVSDEEAKGPMFTWRAPTFRGG